MSDAIAVPTGTVTFLFTDIEGSTRLWQDEPELMRTALAEHDAVLREVIEKRRGFVFKHTGDGVAAAFASAGDAVDAAVDAQARLAVLPFRVRMGLHTGEAQRPRRRLLRARPSTAAPASWPSPTAARSWSRRRPPRSSANAPISSTSASTGCGTWPQPERVCQVGAEHVPAAAVADAMPGNLPAQLTQLRRPDGRGGRGRERVCDRTAS